MNHRLLLWVALWVVCGVMGLPLQAEATHFRGGTLRTSSVNGLDVEVVLEVYQRRDYNCDSVQPTGTCCNNSCMGKQLGKFSGNKIEWGDGNDTAISSMTVIYDSSSSNILGFRETYKHTYKTAGTYKVKWGGCCWVNGVKPSSLSQGSYELEVAVKTGTTNRSPEFQSPTLFNGCVQYPVSYNLNAEDPDKDSVTVSLQKRSGGPSAAGLAVSSAGLLTWSTPVAGLWVVTVKAEDSKGATTYRDFLLSISTQAACANKSPQLTVTPSSATAKVGVEVCATVNVTDPDNSDKFNLQITPTLANVKLNPASVFTAGRPNPYSFKYCWTPSASDANKVRQVLFTATDDGTPPLSAQGSLTFTVQALEVPPVIKLTPTATTQTVKEGASISWTAVASDVDSAIALFAASGQPSFCTVTPQAGNTLNIVCQPDFSVGTKDFTFSLEAKDTDSTPQTTSVSLRVQVENLNRAPSITSTAPSEAFVGRALSYPAKASDPDIGDTFTWSLETKPTGATIDAQSGVMLWTPSPSDVGSSADFTLAACDQDQACSRQSFKVLVKWIACHVDSECPSDWVCMQKQCTPPGCYLTSASCASQEVCLAGTCKADSCPPGGSLQCTGETFCRPGSAQCIKSCALVSCGSYKRCADGACVDDPCERVRCNSGLVCEEGSCVTNRCAGSNVCRHGRICSTLANGCIDDPCRNIICPPQEVCNGYGECVMPAQCTCDGDCPVQTLCVQGLCKIPTCQTQNDCKADEICSDGSCVADRCVGKSCPKGRFCRMGVCIETCAAVTCPTDQVCVDGKCVANPCAGVTCSSGEVCRNGSCEKDACSQACSCKQGRLCQGSSCVDDPCQTIQCPTGQTCNKGQCEGIRSCQVDSDCPGSGVCVAQQCAPEGCYASGQTCADGQLCLRGSCSDNPCAAKTCAPGEVCRPNDGACVPSCPICKDGERCNNGACEPDPCVSVTCQNGQRCNFDGDCVQDSCQIQGSQACRFQRDCRSGSCVDPGCLGMTCPDDATCLEGQCIVPPMPEPGPELGPESSPEPGPESGPEAGPEGPISTTGGGCQCSSRVGHSTGLLGLLGVLLFAVGWRKRRRGGFTGR